MASDQQYRTYDSGGRVCEDECVGRILEPVSGGHPVGCYHGGGASVLEKNLALWQKEKKRQILCEDRYYHAVAEDHGSLYSGGDRGRAF